MGNCVSQLGPGVGLGEVALALEGNSARRTATISSGLDTHSLVLIVPKLLYNRLLKQRDEVELNHKVDVLSTHHFFSGWKRKNIVGMAFGCTMLTMKYGTSLIRRGATTGTEFLYVEESI